MMSFKLAARNVKKSFRDYAIYFLTLMFGVCIFYVFNSIESQQAMMVVTSSQQEIIKSLNRMMGYASVFVSVILGFLILYANSFLIKRRKKELGIYELLGMEKGRISRILMLETLGVGVFSLAGGLLLGTFLSQILAVLTAALFQVKLLGFVFVFSFSAMMKTIFYFGLSFALVMAFNTMSIGRQKLIDLLYADRKNERFKTPRLRLSVVLFMVSAVCLGVAYHLIIENGLLYLTRNFYLSIALGCMGTFLFFFSLSGFFLKAIQQNKRIYLSNLNMFVLRQLNSKINTTYISMTMVCLMLFVSICSLSSGMGLSKALTSQVTELTPYDATYGYSVSAGKTEEARKAADLDMVAALEKEGVDFSLFAEKTVEADYYDSELSLEIFAQTKFASVFPKDFTYTPDLLKLSDYNALLALQGKAPVSLSEHEFLMNCNVNQVKDIQQTYLEKNKIFLGGQELAFKGMTESFLQDTYNPEDMGTLIVPDALTEGKTVRINLLAIKYPESATDCEKICREQFSNSFVLFEDDSLGHTTMFRTRAEIFEQNNGLSITISYLAVYMGLVFLITGAAVLAITQLSEASDNVRRYDLLRKMGAEQRMINGALFTQIGVYFFVPLLLAVVHSVVGIFVAGQVVEIFGELNIIRDSFFSGGVILIVYGGYFAATYLGSRSIIAKTKS